jgi:hypothetical protein
LLGENDTEGCSEIVGAADGYNVGCMVGLLLGEEVGAADGPCVGCVDGIVLVVGSRLIVGMNEIEGATVG